MLRSQAVYTGDTYEVWVHLFDIIVENIVSRHGEEWCSVNVCADSDEQAMKMMTMAINQSIVATDGGWANASTRSDERGRAIRAR